MASTQELVTNVFLVIERLTPTSYAFQVLNSRQKPVWASMNIAGSMETQIEGVEGSTVTVHVPSMETHLLAKLIVTSRSRVQHSFSVTEKNLKWLELELERWAKGCREALQNRDVDTCSGDLFGTTEWGHFVDPYFMPGPAAVTHGEARKGLIWKRPSEIFAGEFKVFLGDIEPNDIQQGTLMDCWLMCALASLAERPQLVKRLFKTTEVSPYGLYRVQFCKNGEWQTVTIDDYFPCDGRNAPIFSRSNGNELWVMLLEKAYAKLHGDYNLLKLGLSREGMIDLTGCPTLWYNLESEEVRRILQADLLWPLLMQFDQDAALIAASTPGEDKRSESRPQDKKGGLVPGHGYSIIQVREAYGHRLLNIRNPWGDFEWEGAWSDQSPLWTGDMVKAINPVLNENDGMFWMNYEDFLRHFNGVTVCLVKPFYEARYKGVFERICEGEYFYTYSHCYFTLKAEERTRVYIGLHQEDERIFGVSAKRPNLDLGLLVLEQKAGHLRCIKRKECTTDRQIELEIELKPGQTYLLLPCSSGCRLQAPNPGPAEPLTAKNPQFRSTLLDVFHKATQQKPGFMSFPEFRDLLAVIGFEIDQSYYESCLEVYPSSADGLTREGFVGLMLFKAGEKGEVRNR